MDAGITRQEALELMWAYLRPENLRRHCLATEAIMRTLAERPGFDAESWGIDGLLYDLDYEETKENPPQHGLKTEAILKEKGVHQEIIDAIKAHNAEALGIQRKTELDMALTCAECITGMVAAATLVLSRQEDR